MTPCRESWVNERVTAIAYWLIQVVNCRESWQFHVGYASHDEHHYDGLVTTITKARNLYQPGRPFVGLIVFEPRYERYVTEYAPNLVPLENIWRWLCG